MNVTPTNTPRERQVATLVMACVGMFVAYLPVTTVSVSLPAIQSALHASTSQLTWVSSAFQLPMAALILTAGVFGDVHGRRKVYLAGLAMAGVGAAVALSAQSVEVLWVGQACAGVGAAALLPSTLALISHAVPDPRKRATFVGLWAASLMAALAVGPMIAGVILDHTAWRWIFLPTVPVAVITLAVAFPLYFGMVQRLDTLHAGYRLLVVCVTSLVVGAAAGRLMHRITPRFMVTTGLLVAVGALLALTSIDADTSFGGMAWRLAVLGVGLGMVITPMTATAVAAVPHHLAGMASAGNNAFRQVGGVLGPAVLVRVT